MRHAVSDFQPLLDDLHRVDLRQGWLHGEMIRGDQGHAVVGTGKDKTAGVIPSQHLAQRRGSIIPLSSQAPDRIAAAIKLGSCFGIGEILSQVVAGGEG